MRKKLLSLLLALLVLSTASAAVGSAAPEVKILVDGSVLETDVQPIIINDRIMLPYEILVVNRKSIPEQEIPWAGGYIY